ncbi:hypothetical protein LXA43DRAFT_714256 [Ganoderma leucocontextum]|nr:hypothetical protein LXA43DRAFT_714256 [Ganoderma leucocontextum]
MLPSPQLSLPPELTDRIIDHLYDDLDSLSACALVCSGWLPSARFHLFRHVTVTCRRLSKLRGVIIRRPEIGPYIRQIVVCCATPDCWTPRCTCLTRKDHTKLCDILTRLPKLHALRLGNMNVFAPPPNLKSVEIVELDGVSMSSVLDLHSWLSAFPRLKSFNPMVFLDTPSKWERWRSALSRLAESFNPMVWLGKTSSKRAAPPDLSHFPVSPTLSATRLFWFADPGHVAEAISDQLIAHGVSRNLRQLSLQLNWRGQAWPPSAMFAFTRSLGPSLTHLEIGLKVVRDLGRVGDLSFSNCPNLKHIRFLDGWRDSRTVDGASNLSTWVPNILSNLRCPRVATICLAMTLDSPPWCWGTLVDQLLSVANARFGSLTRVVFELYYAPYPWYFNSLVDRLPLEVCDKIAKGWHDHRRPGIVYETVLDDGLDGNLIDRPCVPWDEKDDEGVPKRVRVLMTSRDGENPPPQ